MQFPKEKYGFVHHMLFPLFVKDAAYHTDTLIAISQRDDIGCFDCCLPLDPSQRKRAVTALTGCGKQITYVNHLFPAKKISLGSADFAEQVITRDFLERELEAAAAIGADQFLFTSGTDVGEDQAGALARFAETTEWFCGLLRAHNITGLIEPIDTWFDKRFLLGSTADSAAFVSSLRGCVDNLALEVDMGHIPLLFEDFEPAYRVAAPYLRRVHLSNCVMKNPRDPFFGDRHPSFFYPGGQHGLEELRRVLRILKETGFLETPGKLVFEVNPLPGENPDKTIGDHLALLRAASAEL
jgi:sugar phosphate isomerase/epimerase